MKPLSERLYETLIMEGFSKTVDGLLKEVKELETQCDNCAWNIGRTLRLQEEWEAKQSLSCTERKVKK